MQIGDILPEETPNKTRLRLAGEACGKPLYDLVRDGKTLAYGLLHAVAVHARTQH